MLVFDTVDHAFAVKMKIVEEPNTFGYDKLRDNCCTTSTAPHSCLIFLCCCTQVEQSLFGSGKQTTA